jgi:hypothetical protein
MLLSALLAAFIPAIAAEPDPEFTLHFAGTKSIVANPDATSLQELAALPESQPVYQHITRLMANRLALHLTPGRTNSTPAFAAAMADLFRHELVFELTSSAEQTWRLAVRAPKKEADALQKGLRELVTHSANVIESDLDSGRSWRFISKGTDRATHVSYQREWLVVDNLATSQPSPWRSAILRTGRPPCAAGKELYQIGLESRLLQKLIPSLKFDNPFRVELSSTARKGKQRIEGGVTFRTPQSLKLPEFNLPTNTLRDPLISFTAARGIADLFKRPQLREWRLPELPNQLVAWTQSDIPMYSLLALPLRNATAWLKRQTPRFQESLGAKLAARHLGVVTNMTQHSAVAWTGLPLIVPFVTTAKQQEPGWLFFGTVPGFMPKGPNTNPPPAGLLGQIRNRPDLIYYHWEVSEPRLQQWRNITDIGRVLVLNSFPDRSDPFPIWLKRLESRMGNTITEISRVDDRNWKLVRSTQLGFTAMELTLLAQSMTPTLTLPGPPALPGQ